VSVGGRVIFTLVYCKLVKYTVQKIIVVCRERAVSLLQETKFVIHASNSLLLLMLTHPP